MHYDWQLIIGRSLCFVSFLDLTPEGRGYTWYPKQSY